MIWIRLSIAVLMPLVSGFIFMTWLLGAEKGTAFERLFLGFGAGVGLLSFEVFIMGLIGVPFRFSYILITQALAVSPFSAALFFSKDARREDPRPRHRAGAGKFKALISVLLALWIACKIAFVCYEGLNRPILSQDAWMNWAGAAKFFYYSRGLALAHGNEHFFGAGYRIFMGHPLLYPLAEVWVSTALGGFHETLAKAFSPFYYISILGIFFFTVKRESGRFYALIAAFLLSSAPLLAFHGQDGYADLPLAFYTLGGTVFLWRFMELEDMRCLSASGLLFSMGAFTKNEGIIYLASAGLVLAVYCAAREKGLLKGLIYYCLPAAIFIAPWLIFKASYGIGFGHGYKTAGVEMASGGLHLDVPGVYLKELFLSANHGLIFPYLAAVTLLGFGTLFKTNIKYIYLMLLLVILSFLFVYIATNDYAAVTRRTGVNRNTLTFLPAAFLAGTLLSIRMLNRKKDNNGAPG